MYNLNIENVIKKMAVKHLIEFIFKNYYMHIGFKLATNLTKEMPDLTEAKKQKRKGKRIRKVSKTVKKQQ